MSTGKPSNSGRAWAIFGEMESARKHWWLFLLLGILLVLGGIVWVVSDNPRHVGNLNTRAYIIGLLFAFGGAAGQAVGAVTSKAGLEGDFSPLSAHLIRLLVATLAIWVYAALRGQLLESIHNFRQQPRAFRMMSFGTLTGPVIGVWLSLIAFQQIAVGVASTLIALTPIFVLPLAYIVFHERITGRAIAGTVAAFAGTALLFL